MISNYLKVAARNIQKRKLYSFINAIGLSIAMAFCLLIYLYIKDERSFDQMHENKHLIFRIEENQYVYWNPKLAEHERYHRTAYLPVGLAPALREELPEVDYVMRFTADWTGIVKYGDKVFTEKLCYTDGDFFKMMSFPLLAGNADKLFENKLEVVLTPAIAQKYFGTEDPIGKTMLIDNNGEKAFIVAGIIQAPPANSSFDFQIILPQEHRPGYERQLKRWGNFNTPTFVQLKPGADLDTFSKNLGKVVDKYMGPGLEESRKQENIPADIKMMELLFTPLPEMHLKNDIEWHKVSDPQYSYILGGIALLILVIACVNYIALALTTSAARRTEVGVRKVVGAYKKQLIYQFGFESILLAFISMIFGILLVVVFLPSFNEFTAKAIQLTFTEFTSITALALGLSIVIGIFAGSYPAFFLSSFLPALVLKGRFTTKLQAGFTKPLVVIQFALSAFLIISSVIMYQQMSFVTNKNLGFQHEQVLVIPTQTGENPQAGKVVDQFRKRLEQVPAVQSVGATNISFNQGWSRFGYKIDGVQRSAYVYSVDPFYIPTLSMELVKGRNFDPTIPADSNAIIVNEALVRDMKWEDPLNEYYNYYEDTVGLGAKVIGVVKDYHYRSLEAPIEPLFLCMNYKDMGQLTSMLVKVKPEDIQNSLQQIEKAWKELYPDKPFDYTFLDDDVARQYRWHTRWMSIMGFSTGFAILISCLGLFGLAGINAINRTKEIGIRKVMGAPVSNIFVLLNRQYVWLSMIAFTIAIPFSWYVMNKWLSSFQFKIEMGWELFALSTMSGLMIALLTVSYHALRAMQVNPAETLKYE